MCVCKIICVSIWLYLCKWCHACLGPRWGVRAPSCIRLSLSFVCISTTTRTNLVTLLFSFSPNLWPLPLQSIPCKIIRGVFLKADCASCTGAQIQCPAALNGDFCGKCEQVEREETAVHWAHSLWRNASVIHALFNPYYTVVILWLQMENGYSGM